MELPVVVLRQDGMPVTGLELENFTVYEDDAVVDVAQVHEVNTPGVRVAGNEHSSSG